MNSNFWQGKRVLLTGHTGFKGSWAALWLSSMGADVTGFSLSPETNPNLFSILNLKKKIASHIGDINNLQAIEKTVKKSNPEIVIHMAAQALVRRSYKEPLNTFGTNIMGTLNLLSALQSYAKPKAILVVTSDKVYENRDENLAFKETDRLGGDDPYSASKAAAEIVIASWRKSFLKDSGTNLGAARGGNVIGGGDWSEDRLIPDFIRAVKSNATFVLRNPNSTRPWQHVLDVLNGYFTYAEKIYHGAAPPSLNFGPAPSDIITTSEVIEKLNSELGGKGKIEITGGKGLPEKSHLALDNSLAKKELNWQPIFDIEQSIKETALWYKEYLENRDLLAYSLNQIKNFGG